MSIVILTLFQIEVFIYHNWQGSLVVNLIVSCDLVLLHLILVLSNFPVEHHHISTFRLD